MLVLNYVTYSYSLSPSNSLTAIHSLSLFFHYLQKKLQNATKNAKGTPRDPQNARLRKQGVCIDKPHAWNGCQDLSGSGETNRGHYPSRPHVSCFTYSLHIWAESKMRLLQHWYPRWRHTPTHLDEWETHNPSAVTG